MNATFSKVLPACDFSVARHLSSGEVTGARPADRRHPSRRSAPGRTPQRHRRSRPARSWRGPSAGTGSTRRTRGSRSRVDAVGVDQEAQPLAVELDRLALDVAGAVAAGEDVTRPLHEVGGALAPRLAGHPEFEVLGAVVVLDPVDVVHLLAGSPVERPAERLLHDGDVFEHHSRLVGPGVLWHPDTRVPVARRDGSIRPRRPCPMRHTGVAVAADAVVVHQAVPADRVLPVAALDDAHPVAGLLVQVQTVRAVTQQPLIVEAAEPPSDYPPVSIAALDGASHIGSLA
jgi:hypothetical protein